MARLVEFCLLATALADVYMHNPRGSNNRLNEDQGNSGNAQNQARLFDSQNNAKGGYGWGDSLTYYEGSELTVEWTAQHSCGTSNNDCTVVIQYMCSSSSETGSTIIRDGSVTDRIPNNNDPAVNNGEVFDMTTGGAFVYGMHESYAYYQRCMGTQRNMGLYLADQDLNRNDATATRQNNNGARSGFECPEERDYYPYWRPTPWIDVAVLTNDVTLCTETFELESQNVMSKWECLDTSTASLPTYERLPGGASDESNNLAPIYQAGCTGTGEWVETPAWNLPFDCEEAPFSRDNHLGNGLFGYTNHYNWTLPSGQDLDCLEGNQCVCVLRLRYNISTFDVDNWKSLDADEMPATYGIDWFIDWEYNGQSSPLQEDPLVDVGGFNLTLALDTSQYGRVFQDRSFMFAIKERPTEVLSTDSVYNLNVRGKRGNIVQAYPAVEYDFVPTFLIVPQGGWVHFHWTGSDDNPTNNAGEGTEGTDRSNLVQMRHGSLNYPATMAEYDALKDQLPFSDEERLTFAAAGQAIDQCPTYEELKAANNNDQNQIEEATDNCFLLNAAPRHFDGGLYKFSKLGATYDYLSTRNNNFSNRSQKGGIYVTTALEAYAVGLIAGAAGALLIGGIVGVTFYLSKVNPYSAPGKCWGKLKEMVN